MPSSPIVELTDATLIRGGVRVLDRISLRIAQGQHTAILGPNGAGKSSLLRMLTLDDRPLRRDGPSSLKLFGLDTFDVEDVRRRLGVVTGDLDAGFGLGTSGGRVVGLHVAVSGLFGSQGVFAHQIVTDEMWDQARRALGRIEAGHLAARPFNELSTGERRRVLIARALVTDPEALVLDEPTAGLDIVARHQFLESMGRLARHGTTVILVTHHVEEVFPEMQQVALLRGGTIAFAGTPAEALTASRLSGLFGAPVTVERNSGYFHARRSGQYGSWPSPISAASVAAQSLRLSSVFVDDDTVYWVEGRPAEGGRNVLVCRKGNAPPVDLTPPPFNVRTRVHEYGGGAFVADRGSVWFSNFADQRVYLIAGPDAGPRALTSEGARFYADFCVDRGRRRLIAVREDHTDRNHEAKTTLVAIADDGSTVVLTGGRDFYSTPRLSPDGTKLSWICWDHPQMPWDGTELWLAGIDDDGQLVDAGCVAGGKTESIYQPGWSVDGELIYATDRTGWWQLVRQVEGEPPVALVSNAPSDSEFGRPQWTFGTATWASAGRSRLVVSYAVSGVWHLGVVDTRTGELSSVHAELDPQEWLDATADHVFFIGASPRRAPVLARLALDSGAIEVLKESSPAVVESDYLSIAEAIEFPTSGGRTAHAFFYAPVNPAAGVTAASRRSASRDASVGERPPLIAISHGGPTAAAVRTLDLRIQYWTSRGFAVVDVNYGGSSGYGRAYRDRLRGTWGHVDVDDMLHVVAFLADAGRIDRDRTIIRGGSAGGYTTLAALTFHPGVFKAGASYYGVSDLEVLARDTHKFEARYLDTLVGPYPARADEYRARSPIHAIENLACALILFQGLDDKVVPPNQSEMMADAVRRKGLPVAYVAFEGEQHGFRRAENIVRSLEAELYFYAAVFGFTAADRIAPLTIDNL